MNHKIPDRNTQILKQASSKPVGGFIIKFMLEDRIKNVNILEYIIFYLV